jgi:predicted glycosyltransferase
MIWFDLVTPKSVMFFKNMIKLLEIKGREVLVTAREGAGYSEIVELLRLHDIAFHTIGEFGGARLEDKLKASIDRQFALMEFIREKNVEKLNKLSITCALSSGNKDLFILHLKQSNNILKKHYIFRGDKIKPNHISMSSF